MSEWQDISTAPKDGTKFFLWAPGYEWPEVIYWEEYPDDEAIQEAGDDGFWRYADDLFADVADVDIDDATHWMPLPKPPGDDR